MFESSWLVVAARAPPPRARSARAACRLTPPRPADTGIGTEAEMAITLRDDAASGVNAEGWSWRVPRRAGAARGRVSLPPAAR